MEKSHKQNSETFIDAVGNLESQTLIYILPHNSNRTTVLSRHTVTEFLL